MELVTGYGLREIVFLTTGQRPITLEIVLERGTTEEGYDGLAVATTVKQDPPVEVARREVEDRDVGRFIAEASVRLAKTCGPDDLDVPRDQAGNKPTHQIGTVNEKQSCHRSAHREMQGTYHPILGLEARMTQTLHVTILNTLE